MEQRGHWFRAYEDMGDDPKFRMIAKRAAASVPGVRASDALAVWTQLLCRASSCVDRGSIEGYDCETADLSLDMPEGAACALMQAFEDKGMIHDGRILKWEQRQPKREDGAADRAKKWREERNQTQANANERDRTQTNARTEQNREEKTEERSSNACASRTASPGFDEFWQAYPKKKSRGPAEKAWKATAAIRPDLKDILDAIAAHSAGHDWQKEGGKYIPYPASWLNAQGWLDEVSQVRAPLVQPANFRDAQLAARDQTATELLHKMGLGHVATGNRENGPGCFESSPHGQPALPGR